MDRVGEIMERLGFRKEADESAKVAFVKNLIQQAYGVSVNVPQQYQSLDLGQELQAKSQRKEPQQLSFDFKEEGA